MKKENRKDYFKKYRQDNKEKLAAHNKDYREANKEKIAAYRVANKEKAAAYDKAYREANKEKLSAYSKEKSAKYYKANKEKIAAHNKAYLESLKHNYCIYILPKERYIGMTKNIKRRILQHNHRGINTEGYRVLQYFDTKQEAVYREKWLHSKGYKGSVKQILEQR